MNWPQPGETTSGKVQYLPSPVATPGKCIVCGGVDRRVADLGFSIVSYGAVYLCEFCLNEMLDTLGFISKEASEDAIRRAEASTSIDFTQQLLQRNVTAVPNDLLHELRNVSANLLHVTSSASASSNFNSGVEDSRYSEQVSGSPSADESTGDTSVGGTTGQIDDAASDEGSASVSTSPSHASLPSFVP